MKKIIAGILIIGFIGVSIWQVVSAGKDGSIEEVAKHVGNGTDIVDVDEKTSNAEAAVEGIAVGNKAPDFELPTLTGESIKLSDLQGKKVIVNYWATWCPPCKEEIPDFQLFHEKYGSDVVILAVNVDPEYDVESFVNEYEMTFPVLLDEDDQANRIFQVLSIPTTYFIDSNGIIRNKFVGQLSYEKMEKFVDDMN
ncbi:TlpA disulfide reductase family protein [Bacillus sp. SM2101]|uniref:TlpA family protein disulfide reductase n=1 Tax=Bacillus sp. SM2101 TaxID=2805366 RepID=UPI001BDEF8D6|nr:TlpA disulfide reductase family protein [Bacillus sp. SM2101]